MPPRTQAFIGHIRTQGPERVVWDPQCERQWIGTLYVGTRGFGMQKARMCLQLYISVMHSRRL